MEFNSPFDGKWVILAGIFQEDPTPFCLDEYADPEAEFVFAHEYYSDRYESTGKITAVRTDELINKGVYYTSYKSAVENL